MAGEKSKTIEEYINAAPIEGQESLRKLFSILKCVAKEVEGSQCQMKWNTPFFVEPRFLFAFAAHKSHLGFTPTHAGMEHFRDKVAPYETTTHLIKIRYNQEINEDLIREIAEHSVKSVKAREDHSFW